MNFGLFSIILDFVISDVAFVKHCKFKVDGVADSAIVRDCYLGVISWFVKFMGNLILLNAEFLISVT